jgi:putative transposase
MSKQTKNKPKKEAQPRKTSLFRLYPTHKQERKLDEWLALSCEVYNAALDERQSAYRMAGVSLSSGHQCAELPGCKEVRPELDCVPSQVLQDVVKRVDLAFAAFFQRVEEGQQPGSPRFTSRFRSHSLTFKQDGKSFNVLGSGKKNRGTLLLAK